MARLGERGWTNSWWRRAAGKSTKQRGMEETPENSILHMPMEWNECLCDTTKFHSMKSKPICYQPTAHTNWSAVSTV